MSLIRRRFLQGAALSFVGIPQIGVAQDQAGNYPDRTIRIIVGFSPGGAPDIVARLIAKELSIAWGQPVVVENRTGAGGVVAAQYVANAAPDGYTLFCVNSAYTVAPAINKNLNYDTLKDFKGVSLIAAAPTWVLVSPALGIKTLADFIAIAKAKPGLLNFSSAGVGSYSHFSAELFNHATGIKAQHVPYKGPPEALNALIAGEVQYYLSPLGAASSFVRAEKVIPLAVTGETRLPDFPNIPTMIESGFPGFVLETWTGLVAPSATPQPIIDKLNAAVAAALKTSDVGRGLAAMGLTASPTTPAVFDKQVADEIASFSKTAQEAGITVN
jgi:tripartite-type tricarboxylate transporter receptor subunit TctC